MPLRNRLDLRAALAPGQRLLGLDYGRKRLGVAVSDPALTLASPVETIHRSKLAADMAALAALARPRGVGGIVLGLPLNMDGSAGPMAQAVRAFAHQLDRHAALFGGALPILLWDERLTSEAAAERRERGDRPGAVDMRAAAIILQEALDALARDPGDS